MTIPYFSTRAGFVFLLAFPWVSSFSLGPSGVTVQWLITWWSAALAWLLWRPYARKGSSALTLVVAAGMLAATLSAGAGLLQYSGMVDAWHPLIDSAAKGQAYGNLRQRNQFATLMALGLVLALWTVWQVQAKLRGHRASVLCKTGCWAALAVFALASAASGSRTGLLQVVLVVLLAGVWAKQRALLVGVLLAYGAGAWLLPLEFGVDAAQSGILGRLNEPPAACSSRLTLWSNVLHLIAQKPWLGWGWGELDYAHFITLYPGERFCEIMGNAHNLPLHLAVTLGLPVALGVCGVIVWLIWRGKPWAERDSTRQMAWGVLAVIGLHSLLEYPLWYGPFQLAAGMAVWMLWRTRSAQAMQSPSKASAWQWSVAAALLVGCTYAAWDYWRISQVYLPVAQRAAAYQGNTLEKVQGSVLFKDWVQFAELGITPLTAQNAAHVHVLSLRMLHFSPEAMVVERVIESARLLGDEETVRFYAVRYQAAYPDAFAAWSKKTD